MRYTKETRHTRAMPTNPIMDAVAAEAKYNVRRPQTSLTASTLESDSLSNSHLRERHEAKIRTTNTTLRTVPPSEATRDIVLRGERMSVKLCVGREKAKKGRSDDRGGGNQRYWTRSWLRLQEPKDRSRLTNTGE